MDLPRTRHADVGADPAPGHRAARPGRHRATALARAVREAPVQGLPALAPRRAAVAGVGLAAAAIGAGLALPQLTGPEAGTPGTAPGTAAAPVADAVPAVQLVAGRTLWPVAPTDLEARDSRTQPAYVAGVRLRRDDDGAPGDGAASDGSQSAADGSQPATQPGSTGGRDGTGRGGSGSRGGTVGTDGTDGTDGGDGRDAAGGGGAADEPGDAGVLDPVETAVAPVRDALPSPVGDVVDGGVTLVEDTVAGTLGGILP